MKKISENEPPRWETRCKLDPSCGLVQWKTHIWFIEFLYW